jgi:hypothetical protein
LKKYDQTLKIIFRNWLRLVSEQAKLRVDCSEERDSTSLISTSKSDSR